MIRFVASKGYTVEPGEDGQYTVIHAFTPDSNNYLQSENEQFFIAGERVRMWGFDGGEFTNGTITGFVNEGVIVYFVDDAGWRGHMLLTTNSVDDYVVGQAFPYNTDPFLGSPPCFVNGTLIETDSGPVAVESLAVGDKVMSLTGLRTVKWIGWRHYQGAVLRTHEQRAESLPIRILTGALGANLPSQDLRVSPWHHLYIDEVLIRAKDLVNGKSIFQETNVIDFSYYHVELDRFDVILAHGVLSESWADGGNRSFFQNVDVTTLRPKDMQRRRARRPGFKVLREADEIAVIHKRIAARAEGLFIELASKAA
ncbi:Hedgehog/Intein (Hint) domain-containing protein [Bordetella tumbae]|uniref:Hint domain-containing protein n=1 Tax=Bordetella tumbae TaxID=1649139 RepID=UPI0039EE6B4F